MVETSDSPFEDQFEDQLKIVSVPTRLREQGKRVRSKRTKKDKSKLHEDSEIDALMRIYGDRVNVVFDSSAQ
jgi:hypothetical protein